MDDERKDGTTRAMRNFRSVVDESTRPARIEHELRTAVRALTNAADLVELQGADPALIRQDAKCVRDHVAQVRNWWVRR